MNEEEEEGGRGEKIRNSKKREEGRQSGRKR